MSVKLESMLLFIYARLKIKPFVFVFVDVKFGYAHKTGGSSSCMLKINTMYISKSTAVISSPKFVLSKFGSSMHPIFHGILAEESLYYICTYCLSSC
jgi:hypothetical protein